MVPMKPEPCGCLGLQLCLWVYLETPCFSPVALAVMGTLSIPPAWVLHPGDRWVGGKKKRLRRGPVPRVGRRSFWKPQLKGRIGSLIC